jgi:hypothetical protein
MDFACSSAEPEGGFGSAADEFVPSDLAEGWAPAAADDPSVDEDVEPESDGCAYAMPGVLATAIPTPRATANAPTRPMYVA